MPPLARDPRLLHDQILDHDLGNLPAEKLLALLIIEVRRLRVQMQSLIERDVGPAREPS